MPDLDQDNIEALRRLAGRMIPASPAHGAPGADDPEIFSGVLAALRLQAAPLRALLAELAGDARDSAWEGEAGLDGLRQRHGAAFGAIVTAVAQHYYRDDRVMRSLGMEARAPFPKGYDVREGDWTLLDEVQRRAPIWRPAD